MTKYKVINKSWIEKRNHEKTAKRYENGINQAFKLSKDSVVGKLAMKYPPKDYWLNYFKRVSDLYDSVSKEDDHGKKRKFK